MPTDIHQFRGQDSEGAVVGRKRFVELGHFAADSGEPFDQMNLKPHFGKIQGGLHARNSSANNKDIPIHVPELLEAPETRHGSKRYSIRSRRKEYKSSIFKVMSVFCSAHAR